VKVDDSITTTDPRFLADLTQQILADPLPKHIISVSAFKKPHLHQILNLAHQYRLCKIKKQPLNHILEGKVGCCSLSNCQNKF